MVPTPAEVARTRYYLRVVLRFAGCLFLLLAAYEIADSIAAVARSVLTGGGVDFTSWIVRVAVGVSSLGTLGIGLVLLAPRLARWLAPMPSARCPQCDYPLIGVTDGRCPECGLVLGAQATPAVRPSPRPAPRPPSA